MIKNKYRDGEGSTDDIAKSVPGILWRDFKNPTIKAVREKILKEEGHFNFEDS